MELDARESRAGRSTRSFDDSVGAAQKRGREGYAKRVGGLQINEQLDFGDALHRQIGRLLRLEDSAGIDASLAVRLPEIAAIAHQPAGDRKVAGLRYRRHCMANRELGKLMTAVSEIGIGAEDKSARPAFHARWRTWRRTPVRRWLSGQ